MSPEDIQKLLGGYATGTLTTEEQQALFAAALEDQELFDTLAREQSLRDLLRDPAARAELLSALDTPATRPVGFWQWLRRPVVAGLATAGVAAIAMVAVWQGTRMASVKPPAQPVMVAELKHPDSLPAAPSAVPTARAPANQPATNTRDKHASTAATGLADKETALAPATPSPRLEADFRASLSKEKKAVIASAPSPARQTEAGTPSGIAAGAHVARADKKTAPAMAQSPLRQFDAGTLRAKIASAPAESMADNKAVAAMAPPPPPPPPPPAVLAPLPAAPARKAEADAPAAPQVGLTTGTGALQASLPLDARALFYLDQAAPVANAFVQPGGGGGAEPAPTFRTAPQKDAPPPKAKGAGGLIAPLAATAPRLGVRISILRAQSEVDLTAVLNPGETVRLKLIPNADGFLYITEGTRTVASGRVLRLQPFETPELRFKGSGRMQLIVLLSRSPRTAAPLSIESLSRDDLVRSSAGQERATYIVSGPSEAGAQEVVVPVTLTYR
jgi:hypothetical protein